MGIQLLCTPITPCFIKPSQNFSFASPSTSPKRKTTPIACQNHPRGSVDRREILIGLGGLYGANATSAFDRKSFAAPVETPDINKADACQMATPDFQGQTPPPGTEKIPCCPPNDMKTIKDYTIPPVEKPYVRMPAHKMTQVQLENLEYAVSQIKALDDNDPRSFKQQADVHCTYCDGAYNQVGYTEKVQVHNSWIFFPFHRYYLYFFERILRAHAKDKENFALPFWNWDSMEGMVIPPAYNNQNSPLYNTKRNQDHLNVTMNLDFGTDDPFVYEDRICNNLEIMHRQMITGAGSKELFLGEPYSAGSPAPQGAGTLESVPHIPIHAWVGDPTNNSEDMGNFYSSARDMLFYTLHINVDRMWSVWKRDLHQDIKNKDFDDRDWLDASFVFYDENAEPVRVYIRDCLETENLGYIYQDVPLEWKEPCTNNNSTIRKFCKTCEDPQASTTLATKTKSRILKRSLEEPLSSIPPKATFPVRLDSSAVITTVRRPKGQRDAKAKEKEEEALLLSGIQLDRGTLVKFDVYINAPVDRNIRLRPGAPQVAGSFCNLPSRIGEDENDRKYSQVQKFGLTKLLENIGDDDKEDITVTLVPQVGKVTVGGVGVVYLEK